VASPTRCGGTVDGIPRDTHYATGVVSFTADQSGAVLTWGGEFDVPVRFDSEFPVELLDQQIQSVTFALMGLRL